MTTCTQPGCTGTIVDDYCDVCGSPASAPATVPAGVAAAAAASPAPAAQQGPTPVPKTMACHEPGCTGTIVDDYCDVCGTPASAPVPAKAVAASTASPSTTALTAAPGMRACTQPGCTGTIVDDYCDVCGSPASAPEPAPRSGTTRPRTRSGTTRARTRSGSTRARTRSGITRPAAATAPPDSAPAAATAPPASAPPAAATAPPDSAPAAAAADAAPAAATASAAHGGWRGLTAVRRVVGAAAVLLLLAGAVVFYRVAPDYSTSGSTPNTAASPSPSPAPTSVVSPSQSAPTSTTTPSAADKTSGSAKATIQVETPVSSANLFETVQIQGTYHGGANTFVQVQRYEAGKWVVAFPLPTKTDQSGKFTAYVALEQPGRHRLRVLDPDSGTTSKTVVLVIKA